MVVSGHQEGLLDQETSIEHRSQSPRSGRDTAQNPYATPLCDPVGKPF